MSVTFSVYHDGKFLSPEGWVPVYEDDPQYGKIQINQNPLEMNVANGNYVRLMELLGLDYSDYCGTWGDGSLQHLQERLGVILEGLKAMPEMDSGVPSTTGKGNGGCKWVDCGLREGYFTERLSKLQELVFKAIEVGGVITFG